MILDEYDLRKIAKTIGNGLNVNSFLLENNGITYIYNKDSFPCEKCSNVYNTCIKKWRDGGIKSSNLLKTYCYICPKSFTFLICKNHKSKISESILIGPIIIKSLAFNSKDSEEYQVPVVSSEVINSWSDILFSLTNIKSRDDLEMKRRKKYLQDEVDDNIKLFMKMSHNFESIYCMEDRLINCIKSGDLKNWEKIAKNIITVTLIEEGNSIDNIKKKLIQTYYLTSRSILDEVLPSKTIKEVNEKNINKTKHIFEIDEIMKWFMDSILSIYNEFCGPNKRIGNLTAYRIEKYVSTHFKENISLKLLSEKYGKSYNYLSSIFNQEMKMSFKQYLNNYRIKKAEEMLKESEVSLSNIAFEVGFSNQSYFSKVFKKNTGVTPLKYRNAMKKS